MEQPLWINPNCPSCAGTGAAGSREDQYSPPGVCQQCLAWASANGIQIPTEITPRDSK